MVNIVLFSIISTIKTTSPLLILSPPSPTPSSESHYLSPAISSSMVSSTKPTTSQLCLVCSDTNAAFHCGAIVCEACKVTFTLELAKHRLNNEPGLLRLKSSNS